MREPIAQPLTIDGALLSVRNESLVLNALGLRGVIVMWSGAIAEVPPGWGLCDGSQGTPDLREGSSLVQGRMFRVWRVARSWVCRHRAAAA